MSEDIRPIPLFFWRTLAGQEPVRDFLQALPREDQRTIGRDLAMVQFGWPIGMPICRALGGGLWEVRSSLPSGRIGRVLFGFHDGRLIAVHGFIEKTQKTPPADLTFARQRMKDLSR